MSKIDSVFFHPPLDTPLYLSGNFGELRNNHFHSGIDIKTEGREGKNVYSIEDGIVSRIKISPWGYGKTVYIKHNQNYTSVYAHLQQFNEKINNYVKKYQYINQTYSMDIELTTDSIHFKRGEIIGLSGNTGSSEGPHLHFEIRRTDNEEIVNGLFFNFNIKDDIPPTISKIYIYPIDNKSNINNQNRKKKFQTKESDGQYKLSCPSDIVLHGNIGFGIETYDFLNHSNNICGIYSIQLLIDSVTYFQTEFHHFTFKESKYLNGYIDYEEYLNTGKKIHRAFQLPNNPLSIYKNSINRGLFYFHQDTVHTITFIIKDVYLNESQISFKVKSTSVFNNDTVVRTDIKKIMPYQIANYYEEEDCIVKIPKGALFDTVFLKFSVSDTLINGRSKTYHIHEKNIPLRDEYSLSIKLNSQNALLKDKLLIASIRSGKYFTPVESKYEDGYITGDVNFFGSFTIVLDTTAPRLIPVHLYKNAKLSEGNKIMFRISDEFSGISIYNGYVDNQWVLFEYDPKKGIITYTFDENIKKTGELHHLFLEVYDQCKNRSIYETKFYY